MTTRTMIRPGLLVALSTNVRGGVSYERVDLEEDANTKRWETTRRMTDPEEHDRAVKVRGQAAAMIRGACIQTGFGLLCPLGQEQALDVAAREARELVAEHNRASKWTQVSVRMLKGQVASSDVEAATAIAGEMAELVRRMEAGIRDLDPKAIRDAAGRARQASAMLAQEQQDAVGRAVAAARSAARQIVRRVEKAGEDSAGVLKELEGGVIQTLRMTYLDMEGDGAGEDAAPPVAAMPAVEVQRLAEVAEEVW